MFSKGGLREMQAHHHEFTRPSTHVEYGKWNYHKTYKLHEKIRIIQAAYKSNGTRKSASRGY